MPPRVAYDVDCANFWRSTFLSSFPTLVLSRVTSDRTRMGMTNFGRKCSCRSAYTPCGAWDWLRLGTAIPSAPSPSPRLGAVQPVRCDLHLDLYVRSLDA